MSNISVQGWTTATPSVPARALGTPFQPSTAKAVLCIYTVRIVTTATIAGSQDGQVQLKSDSSATPTTVRCQARNGQALSLAITLQSVNTQDSVLVYLCPPGDYVNLVAANNTGSPTISIAQQTEVALS